MKTLFTRARHLLTGKTGEQIAAKYVRQKLRRKVLHANWKCRSGELDLIACDPDTIYFIEVKTRSSSNTKDFPIIQAVDVRKQSKITQLSKIFLNRQRRYVKHSVRYEVICVEYCESRQDYRLTHYPDAWRES